MKENPFNPTDFEQESQKIWEEICRDTPYPNERQKEILKRQGKALLSHQDNKKPLFRFFREVAAIAVIILFCFVGGYLLTHLNTHSNEQFSITEISTNKSEIRSVSLPDGSKIMLNTTSTLSYTNAFMKDVIREVHLDGEAFFDITPNPERPFIIRSNNFVIKVLGTSFNVKDYTEDNQLSVSVESGSVNVNYDNFNTIMTLKKDETMTVDKTTHSVTKQLRQNELPSIRQNSSLYFNDVSLSESILLINRYYQTKVVLASGIVSTAIITGTHDNQSLESVLQSICFTAGLKYRQTEKGYEIYQ